MGCMGTYIYGNAGKTQYVGPFDWRMRLHIALSAAQGNLLINIHRHDCTHVWNSEMTIELCSMTAGGTYKSIACNSTTVDHVGNVEWFCRLGVFAFRV